MPSRTTMIRIGAALLGAVALALAVACARQLAREDVPPQGWWSERGPVVPHDSFPADCSLCHVGGTWRAIRADFAFDHETETGVALTGAHARAECLRCHNDRGPVAMFKARGCRGCHEDVHRGELGRDCSTCHSEEDWRPSAVIASHMRTRFPLVGSHAAVPCWRCHEGAEIGVFTGLDIECVSCHADDLARAATPDHAVQGWVDRCDRCHIPTTWTGGGFNHGTWPLTGAHRAIACTACHAGDVFAGTPRDCVACHQTEYDGAPDHVADGYPLQCDLCHNTTTWEGARFNHVGIVSGCVNCHLDDWTGTTDPDHAAMGFSQECQQCHGTTTWLGAHFDHAGIVDGCIDCHLADWQATNDPDHTAAGFPQECQVCHTTRTWTGATFDHDFPIQSGHHSHLDCADCHLVPGDYSTFSCIDCHEHQQSEMDSVHHDVAGYTWTSPACYSCHPNG